MPEPQYSIEAFLGFWAMAVRIAWLILPVVAIAGVCGELTRGENAVSTPRARALFSAFSVVMILFTLSYCAFCFWFSQAYDRVFAFMSIEVGIRMTPTVILAIIQLLLHSYRRKGRRDSGTV